MNLTGICEDLGSIPGLPQWAKDVASAMGCGIGHGQGSDLMLQWLRCRPVATGLIRPLAWEPPYTCLGCSPEKKKKSTDVWHWESAYYVKAQNLPPTPKTWRSK